MYSDKHFLKISLEFCNFILGPESTLLRTVGHSLTALNEVKMF